MFGNEGGAQTGVVIVKTTSHKGLDIDYWADILTQKLIFVADESDSVIKEQALAFQDAIRQVSKYYITQAIRSDRTTLYNLLIKQGEREMAELLRRL